MIIVRTIFTSFFWPSPLIPPSEVSMSCLYNVTFNEGSTEVLFMVAQYQSLGPIPASTPKTVY